LTAQLTNENPYFKALGIRISVDALVASAFQLHAPSIVYGRNSQVC
jgi:hypothetical protein